MVSSKLGMSGNDILRTEPKPSSTSSPSLMRFILAGASTFSKFLCTERWLNSFSTEQEKFCLTSTLVGIRFVLIILATRKTNVLIQCPVHQHARTLRLL